MLERPILKRYYHLHILNSESICLFGEKGHHMFEGYLYPLIVPLLNGHYSYEDLVHLLHGKASRQEILYIIIVLETNGFLAEGDDSLEPGVAAFWQSFGQDTRVVSEKLRNTSVEVISLSSVSPDLMIHSLCQLGVQVADKGDFLVVLVNDYLQADIDILNQQRLNSGRAWMLIKPVGTRIWLGPIFRTEATGCWSCLSQRLWMNRPLQSFVKDRQQSGEIINTLSAVLPSSVLTAINIAATEVVKYIVGSSNHLEGKIVTLDTISLHVEEHILTRRPQCLSCGTPIKQERNALPFPITLKSYPKKYAKGFQQRQVPPEVTIAQYQHHVSSITGIVRTLEPIKDWNNGLIYNVYSGPNVAIPQQRGQVSELIIRSHNGGKGNSVEQAKASALCEAIERYCWLYKGDEWCQKASFQQLGKAAIHPNECMNFSDTQYLEKDKNNTKHLQFFSKIPEPFDESSEIEWAAVWSLTQQEFKYLPMLYCYRDYPVPPKGCFAYADSNGLASGNSREEAILHGLFELVERDSVGIWWFNQLQKSEVDLSSFHDPYFENLRQFYETIGRKLWVLDLTTDLGIPTFAAISSRINNEDQKIIFGFGTHFDPSYAILRALTEANQFLPSVENETIGTRPGYIIKDDEMSSWLKTATLQNQPYLTPQNDRAKITAQDYKVVFHNDFRDDVHYCVDLLNKHGMNTYVLDLTHPDILLPVVKVIVPGLRHFWRRLAPGRLYDVPVKMGCLEAPKAEEELNPIGVFF